MSTNLANPRGFGYTIKVFYLLLTTIYLLVMRKVMIFGTFDGIHRGHREFLKEAKNQGDYLIAVIAQDHVVEHLKGHLPEMNLEERFRHLSDEDEVDQVVIGDAEIETWRAIQEYRPEIIALGYDQTQLAEALLSHIGEFDWHPEIKIMRSHEPNVYHSSILKKTNNE